MSSSTLLLMNLRSIHFPVLRQTFWGKTIFNLACTFKKDSFGFSTSLSSACFSQYKRGQRKNRHIWVLATKNLDTAISGELESKETTHKVKKKVALWLGYVGSDFKDFNGYLEEVDMEQLQGLEEKGLQSQRTSGCQQNAIGMAIEDELEKAIYMSGGILESNYGNLHKVSWVRSSRTDKGVHSLSTVISMKMEVPFGTWTSDPDGTSLVDSVNLFLPSSIRVFSIVPVNKSFDARWSCYSRTYSYLLPAAILGINQSTSINERNERIEKLQTTLRLFEGRYPFHNYTVRSRYRYRSKKPFTSVSRPGENFLEQEDLNEGDEEQSVNEFGFRTKANDTLRNSRTADGTRRMMINEEEMDSVSWDEAMSDLVSDIDNRGPTSRKAWWVHEPDGVDKIGTAHFRKIYSCSCGQVEVYGDVCFVRIIITGESFMLHQVRKMVGTAVAVLRDVLPVDIIQVSLSRHSRVILPLAPAEGLVLSNSEFLPFKRGHISSDRFTKLKTDSENSRLKMSSLVASKAQTFWQNTLLPRMFPLMDASNLPWSAWVETLESHGGIPAAEISELQYAWSSWKENNFLKKQQMHQEEQKWFELSGTTECNTRLQA